MRRWDLTGSKIPLMHKDIPRRFRRGMSLCSATYPGLPLTFLGDDVAVNRIDDGRTLEVRQELHDDGVLTPGANCQNGRPRTGGVHYIVRIPRGRHVNDGRVIRGVDDGSRRGARPLSPGDL